MGWTSKPAASCTASRSFASSKQAFSAGTPSEEDDTHDDFRPQVKASPSATAEDQIKQDITNNKVFIYMKVGQLLRMSALDSRL